MPGGAHFNPRSREGSDQGTKASSTPASDISIHAPAKGATGESDTQSMWYMDFNPRSREGSDYALAAADISGVNFNPRSREGSDIGGNYVDFVAKIFQSTLPRRERLERDDPAAAFFYFNPRSREGSDSNIIQQISFSLYNTVYFVSNNIK